MTTQQDVQAGLEQITIESRLALDRGVALVVVPIYGEHALFVNCIESVLAKTPVGVPILVADDASPDQASERYLRELDQSGALVHRIYYVRQPHNVGFVKNVNSAFEIAAPADIVILNSDCAVGDEWLERLREAAYSDSAVATATALSNHGTILSVPERNRPQPDLPSNHRLDEVATAVRRGSLRLRPRIPTAIGHCVYIRRSALDLVGPFDTAFSPGYGEEVDFSQRCALRGLLHVAADDVFVYHRGGGTFRVDNPVRTKHEAVIARRYPYYHQQVAAVERHSAGPLAQSLRRASTSINGTSVTIDARCLGPTITGTQVHVLELIHALARTRAVRLRVVVPSDMSPWVAASLARLEHVVVIRADQVDESTERSAVVHRPYQVFQLHDLELIPRLGQRFILTHQDLIAYRNPGYSRSFLDWEDLHKVTRLSLSLADYVVFFSHHAARDALADDLVDERRIRVAHLGVDHQAAGEKPEPSRPAALERDVDADFILCIGTNFVHKNRTFALRVLAELQSRHDWPGHLVFAGPHAAAGTSADEEAAFLSEHPQVGERTTDLRAISESEKAWLFRHARGVLFPSVYEGFGLVPFEAAEYGTPCFYAFQTSLTELLPERSAALVQWDPGASADNIHAALRDVEKSRELVEAVRNSAESLTWDRTAHEIVDVYELAARDRDRDIARLTYGDVGPLEAAVRLTSRDYDGLALPPDVYRAFRALATRPALRPWFFRLLLLLHSVGYFILHRRRRPR